MAEFLKAKIIWIVLGVGVLLISLFSSGIYTNMFPSNNQADNSGNSIITQNDKPQVVSTIPDNLDQSTILPNQTIEIHFSQPLENLPETRWLIEPSADIKAEVINDRKTLRLTPNKPFNLGQSYTLFIKGDTKIEGKKTLEKEYQYHFKTIEFKGG